MSSYFHPFSIGMVHFESKSENEVYRGASSGANWSGHDKLRSLLALTNTAKRVSIDQSLSSVREKIILPIKTRLAASIL